MREQIVQCHCPGGTGGTGSNLVVTVLGFGFELVLAGVIRTVLDQFGWLQ